MKWLRTESRLIGRTALHKILRELILFLAVPGGLWWAGVHLRGNIMRLDCQKNPLQCSVDSVNAFDRFAIGNQNDAIDKLSFVTQNWSGYLALAVPAALYVTRAFLSRLSPTKSLTPVLATVLTNIMTDLILLLQATVMNGLLMEAVRWTAQRARPFVFQDPAQYGGNPAHYTSFYSGHTSFSALAVTTWVLTLLGRGAPRPLIAISAVFGAGLIVSTASLRVAAGRHFPTDTVAGAIAGVAVALLVARLHRVRSTR